MVRFLYEVKVAWQVTKAYHGNDPVVFNGTTILDIIIPEMSLIVVRDTIERMMDEDHGKDCTDIDGLAIQIQKYWNIVECTFVKRVRL